MDSTLNPVDAGLGSVVESQPAEPTTATVETVTGESESAVPAEQQTAETKPTEAKAEKPKQTPEENAQYKALRQEEKARAIQEALAVEQAKRDAKIAAKGLEWNGKKITTEADYEAAISEKEQVDALTMQGYTEEAALLKIERDALKAEKAQREAAAQEETKRTVEYNEFLEYFKAVNGKEWNPDTDVIPQEVFKTASESKIPLKYAYAEHKANELLKTKAGLETGKATAEANAANATTTTGSITGSTAAPGVITQAEIDAHANDTAWMYKHYNEVMKVVNKKKG